MSKGPEFAENNFQAGENAIPDPVIPENEKTVQDSEAFEKSDTELDKVAELNERYLRLYAEYDNYRKRTQKQRVDDLKFAGEEFLKGLLPVVDDFDRGIQASVKATDMKAINEGMQLVYSKLQAFLKQKSIEVMDVKGALFNADTMEAITKIPAESDAQKGMVVEEIEKGYTLNGKVIRFAKVIVAF